MGLEASPEEQDTVLRMVKAELGPYWLLELPDCRWAAFWKIGFDGDNGRALASGVFRGFWPCAYISDNRYDVESWIEEARNDMRLEDPLNAEQF